MVKVPSKIHKDYRATVKAALELGWTVEQRTHFVLKPPADDEDQSLIIVPATPSDWRSQKNFTALCKRRGVVASEKKRKKEQAA